jgi:hypothetical protein
VRPIVASPVALAVRLLDGAATALSSVPKILTFVGGDGGAALTVTVADTGFPPRTLVVATVSAESVPLGAVAKTVRVALFAIPP